MQLINRDHHHRCHKIIALVSRSLYFETELHGFRLHINIPAFKAADGSKLFFTERQRGRDDGVHVVVLVLSQPSAEDDLAFLIRQLFILQIQSAVLFVVDGIIRLITGLPFRTVLPADHRLGQVIALIILAELEPFMLNNSGPGSLSVGIVGVSLSV